MSGLMWAKRMLFEGGKKGCRRSQRRNGESAFLKSRKALNRVRGGEKLMELTNGGGDQTGRIKQKKGN